MSTGGGEWQRAGGPIGRTRFTWNALLWGLIYPQRRQQIRMTTSGVLLIGLSFGIGTAAYNAANNILFITLSLLLACLVLSGVLSWLNFRRVAWQLQVVPPLRVGQEAVVTLGVRNLKRIVPTYGLWFDLLVRAVGREPPAKAESTFNARGIDVRAAFKKAEEADTRERLFLRSRLDPGADVSMDWVFRPKQRGKLFVKLEHVGSLFPFGFLNKSIAAGLRVDAIVWPAPVEYRRFPVAASRRPVGGERMARAGTGSDLLALRRYERGDSHGLIHWKASARTGHLLVRQLAAESMERFDLWLRTDQEIWSRNEQFELLVSFVATLIEDLFRADKLTSVALNNEAPTPVRRLRDVEAFLDRLAELEPARGATNAQSGSGTSRTNLITLAPDGPRGVAAWVQGQKIAAA
ncbi:MAG: DUF58 domain-containing protein [Opitutus sp.]